MRAIVLAAGLIMATVLTGCAQKQKEMPAPPPPPELTQDTLNSIKADFEKIDPSVRVGAVTGVRPDPKLAAVEKISLDGLRQGISVSLVGIINGQQTTLANGLILSVDNNVVIVKYTPASGAVRAPAKDDLAVVFTNK